MKLLGIARKDMVIPSINQGAGIMKTTFRSAHRYESIELTMDGMRILGENDFGGWTYSDK